MKFIDYVREQWDRATAVAAFLLGLLALLLGWIGTSSTPHVADQMPYIVSGGLLGIFLLGAAAALWLSADLRDEWRELHAVRELLREHVHATPSQQPAAGETALSVAPRARTGSRRVAKAMAGKVAATTATAQVSPRAGTRSSSSAG